MLMLAFAIGATAQSEYNNLYYVFIDITDPELVDSYKKKIKDAIPEMVSKSRVKDGNGIEIKFFAITNLQQGARASFKITPREISFFESKYKRPDEIDDAMVRIPGILKRFKKAEYPHTRIVDAIQQEMDKYKSTKAKNKTIIVFSDLFENKSTHDEEKLDWKNIYFVRGISEPLNQSYVDLGDEWQMYWKKRIPNVKISTELEL